MIISWHRNALREFDKAVDYYRDEKVQLGWRFRTAVLATINRIQGDPAGYECLRPTVYRCRVSRFPYCVVFSVSDEKIEIVAITHHHRDPDYWESRVEQE